MRYDEWQHQLRQLAARYQRADMVAYITEACRNRRAFLFLAPDGWVVLEPRAMPFRHVFVLAAYCTGQTAIARYEGEIFAFAARLQTHVVRFEGARSGYARVMPKRGWRLLADGKTWEKDNGWWWQQQN